jgi:hypothetical protein
VIVAAASASAAARELGAAIPERVRPRVDRLMMDGVAQVVGEFRHRRVSLIGVLLQRLRDDRVEITAQAAPQPFGCRRALGGALRDLFDRAALDDRRRHAARFGVDDGLDDVGGRSRGRPDRILSGEQLVEQHAERVDVGRGRNRPAADLLGGRVLRREPGAGLAGQRRVVVPPIAFQQLGNAEVEQLHLTVAGHEHVRGFQVAVHDQVGVRVRHRREDVEEQPDARIDPQRVLVAMLVEVPAVNVLQHQIRLAGTRDAGVDETRDVRMSEARENGAFALEAFSTSAPDELGVEQLHRGLTLESAVAARREPYAAHATSAERLDQRVGADGRAFERFGPAEAARALVEESGRAEDAMLIQQRLDVCRQLRLLGAEERKPGVSILGCEPQGVIEMRADPVPAAGVEFHGACALSIRRSERRERRRHHAAGGPACSAWWR